jgi:hypothetical protein
MISQTWDRIIDGRPIPHRIYLFGRDINNRLISKRESAWEENRWKKVLRLHQSYDAGGHLSSRMEERWDADTKDWMPFSRHGFSYEDRGLLWRELSESFKDEKWDESWRTTYAYDSEGRKTVVLYEEVSDSVWIELHRTTLTYDPDGTTRTEVSATRRGGQWVNTLRHIYSHDQEGRLESRVLQVWYAGTWLNYLRRVYEYDTDGRLTLELWQEWILTTMLSVWQNMLRVTYGYDGEGNLLSGVADLLGDGDWQPSDFCFEWQDSLGNSYSFCGYRLTLHYGTGPTDVADGLSPESSSFGLDQNYPNPFNPATEIGFRIDERGEVSLQVFDLLGREVATLLKAELPPGHHVMRFDGAELPSGVYLYRLQARGRTLTRRMVLIR